MPTRISEIRYRENYTAALSDGQVTLDEFGALLRLASGNGVDLDIGEALDFLKTCMRRRKAVNLDRAFYGHAPVINAAKRMTVAELGTAMWCQLGLVEWNGAGFTDHAMPARLALKMLRAPVPSL